MINQLEVISVSTETKPLPGFQTVSREKSGMARSKVTRKMSQWCRATRSKLKVATNDSCSMVTHSLQAQSLVENTPYFYPKSLSLITQSVFIPEESNLIHSHFNLCANV